MDVKAQFKSHGGLQGVYTHMSECCRSLMTFAVFVPAHEPGERLPVLWYLSGLTCTHANVMDKGEYRAAASRHRVIVVCPDTSPRGEGVADDPGDWKLGCGASFYVDATQAPWSSHYQMFSYVTRELPETIARNFPADMTRQSVFGHSMGGHGALIAALKSPGLYCSCSAFAPIAHPMTADWSRPALQAYLGDSDEVLRRWDAVSLIEDGARLPELLVDQGLADQFLADGLRPHLLDAACTNAGIKLTLRLHEGYDHSYFFISTFMAEHVGWHAERLRRS